MEKLTKEDIGWIFQSAVFYFEKEEGTKQMQYISPKHILIGHKVLKLINEEWRE